MDIVSYSVAAKQKQRIEQVIANPDSTSGVVTTPSVIATGETITIPTGRTAVLPNTTVNGTLVVDGEVFIPSGSSYTATNINVTGAGSRITGDFSNSTFDNMTMFQTSTVNNSTNISAIPNGTGNVSTLRVFNSSTPGNSSFGQLRCGPTEVGIYSTVTGTGTYLPMTFYTGGAERMRIDTNGNVLVTGAGGLGYGAGSGGTVTQLTSKSTNVTLNKPTGKIVMNNASLASNTTVSFLLVNSLASISDTLSISQITGTGSSGPYMFSSVASNGGFLISVRNMSGGSLSEAIGLNFTIIKGATA